MTTSFEASRPLQVLLDQLVGICPEPFDCVIHVGAGKDAGPSDYSRLHPKCLDLIDADPEVYALLQERYKGKFNTRVAHALVTPEACRSQLHRFTLPRCNGPLDLGRLRELYPGIERSETMPMQGQALSEVLHQDRLGNRNLLIFDIPGQEAPVLRALPRELLARFGWVAISASAEAWQAGAEPLGATLSALRDRNFELARESGDDPAWPCLLLQYSEVKARTESEMQEMAQLMLVKAAQLQEKSKKIDALALEKNALSGRLASLETEHSDLGARHSSVVAERDSLSSQLAGKTALVEVLEREKISREEEVQSLARQQESLLSERDFLTGRVSELVARVEQLEAQIRLIDDEFGKAEGQIELIKDIFLRETTH